MIRKTMTAVTVAGALALGTASATSLGTFDSPTFAASTVDLLDCQVTGDLLTLVPDLANLDVVDTAATFDLETVDVTALLTALNTLDANCLVDTVLDLVLMSGTTIVGTIQVTDLDGTPVITGVPTGLDVVTVDGVRAVLRDA